MSNRIEMTYELTKPDENGFRLGKAQTTNQTADEQQEFETLFRLKDKFKNDGLKWALEVVKMRVLSVVLVVMMALLLAGCGDKSSNETLPEAISELPDCNPHPKWRCKDVSMSHHRFRFPFETFLIRSKKKAEGGGWAFKNNVYYTWGSYWVRLTCCGSIKAQAGLDLQFPGRLMIHIYDQDHSGGGRFYGFHGSQSQTSIKNNHNFTREDFYRKYHSGHGLDDFDENFWIVEQEKLKYLLEGVPYFGNRYLLLSKRKLLRGRQVILSCTSGCKVFSLSQPDDTRENLRIVMESDALRPEPFCSEENWDAEKRRRVGCLLKISQSQFIERAPGFLQRFDAALREWEVISD